MNTSYMKIRQFITIIALIFFQFSCSQEREGITTYHLTIYNESLQKLTVDYHVNEEYFTEIESYSDKNANGKIELLDSLSDTCSSPCGNLTARFTFEYPIYQMPKWHEGMFDENFRKLRIMKKQGNAWVEAISQEELFTLGSWEQRGPSNDGMFNWTKYSLMLRVTDEMLEE